MTFDEVKSIIDEGIDEIAVTRQSLADAKSRAARFLTRVAMLTNFLKDLEDELPKHLTMVNMQYASAIRIAEGKNITEKKVEAEANHEYSNAVEVKAKLDALHNWVKSHIKNFENAHVMFRQYANSNN